MSIQAGKGIVGFSLSAMSGLPDFAIADGEKVD